MVVILADMFVRMSERMSLSTVVCSHKRAHPTLSISSWHVQIRSLQPYSLPWFTKRVAFISG